jgi:hypothetical protein
LIEAKKWPSPIVAVLRSNLANTLARLGVRENSTTRLEEAVNTYDAGLRELGAEKAAVLGTQLRRKAASTLALWACKEFDLGQYDGGKAGLAMAIEVCSNALTIMHAALRKRTPIKPDFYDWISIETSMFSYYGMLAGYTK